MPYPVPNRISERIKRATAVLLALALIGCGTTVQRVGTEQLLLSEAVDSAISEIDFTALRDRKVYVDRTFLQTMQTNNVVDANYVVSGLRQQLLGAGCLLQDSRDDADVIVEPRVGSLGGDRHDVVYGIPSASGVSAAASALAQLPLPSIPELSVGRMDSNSAVAKIAVFAYDRVSRQPIWQSGNSRARSTARSTWVMGIGPFQRGSVYRGTIFAGEKLGTQPSEQLADRPVEFKSEYHFPSPSAPERVAHLLDPAGTKPAASDAGPTAPPTTPR